MRDLKNMLLCFCLLAVQALGQTVTTTGGSINTVPKFTGSTTIGDSSIVETSGSVGIGTTTPNSKLNVRDSFAGNLDVLILDNNNGANGSGVTTAIRLDNGPNQMGRIFTRRDNNEFVIQNIQTVSSAGITFQSGSTNIGRFDASGNFGIGTMSPTQKLDVSGNVQISGASSGLIFPNGTVQTTAAVNTGGTITGVTAGSGLSGGGTTGSVSLAVDSTVVRTNASQTLNGNLTVNGTVTATHINSSDFTTALHGNCVTESFATAYVLNSLGQNTTSQCTYGPGSPINPVLGTIIPYSGILSTLQVVQTSLSSADNFGGTIQVYLEPFNQVGGWASTSLTCTLTASTGNSLNSTTTCTDGTHTTSVSAGQKILVSVTPPQNGNGEFAPVAAKLNLTF